MKKLLILLPMLMIALASPVLAENSQTVTGDISEVIVYRGQALVTRLINVDLEKGNSEVIVENLPSGIVPETLYSQTTGGIKVLSVRYREKTTREDTREDVKKLISQIEEIEKQIRISTRKKGLAEKLYGQIDKIKEFSLSAEHKDLDRGLLQFESVIKINDYVDEKKTNYHNELLELTELVIGLEKELAQLNNKRNRLGAGHKRTYREAVIYLDAESKGRKTFELNYLVNGANWTPQYNLRADTGESIALIEYNAIVHQSSGEDWTGAELALSTAQPSMVSSAPSLDPMKITLTTPGALQANNKQTMMPGMMPAQQQGRQFEYLDQTQQFEKLVRSRRSASQKGFEANITLNRLAVSNQALEFAADRDMLKKMQTQAAVIKSNEGVSVMYRIPGRLTLPSRNEQQLLSIAAITAKAEFTLLATPLLTDYVYMQGELLNDSNTILLPGPASSYRDDEFVGKTQMRLVTIGQKFTAGFGVDSQVQVTREFKDKKTETLWGNRVDEQKYKIEISNYKTTPVKLRLLERLPYTENPNIEILLTNTSHSLSTDKEYTKTQKDKGILRWDIVLSPSTSGDKTTVVEYSYTMKYDNDMRVTPIDTPNGQ